MKNWEKYEKEIRKIGVNLFALIDGEPHKCGGSYCRDCDFYKQNPIDGVCSHDRTEWLYQDDEIRVGDIIKHKDSDEVVVYVTNVTEHYFSGFGISPSRIGQTWWMCPISPYVKTNKHIPLDKVIELIGGAK